MYDHVGYGSSTAVTSPIHRSNQNVTALALIRSIIGYSAKFSTLYVLYLIGFGAASSRASMHDVANLALESSISSSPFSGHSVIYNHDAATV